MSARLVLVPTPIGNLGDISKRAVEVLVAADVIACEDTRHTRTLLSAHAISGKRLLAVHEHNESAAAEGLVKLAQMGQVVALVTDAGTPGISDPGVAVVRAFVDAGIDVECLPGPAAFVVALAISSLPTDRFIFEGFLPVKGPARAARLAELATGNLTRVFYEAPHRMVRTITDLLSVCGSDRPVSISRELTKRFETTLRLSLGEALLELQRNEPRGEYVIVLGGAPVAPSGHIDDDSLRALIASRRQVGDRTRDAVDAVAARTGVSRRRVYELAIEHVPD